jgi:hypothetical protein
MGDSLLGFGLAREVREIILIPIPLSAFQLVVCLSVTVMHYHTCTRTVRVLSRDADPPPHLPRLAEPRSRLARMLTGDELCMGCKD